MTQLRIAHISDLHIGGIELRHRRALAALENAKSWGADHLLITGDLTGSGRLGEYQELGHIVSTWGKTATIVPGNHDGGSERFLLGMRSFFPRFSSTSTPGHAFMLGSCVILPLDTQYARRALVFRALGNVGEVQLSALAGVVRLASSERHVLIAMHHGPQDGHPLSVFTRLTDRGRVNKILAGNPHVSVCCGHDHKMSEKNRVFVAASVATYGADPLRVYEVLGGNMKPIHRDTPAGDYFSFAGLKKEKR